ncbi:acyl-homoserine-lactone synthase [Aestuariispira ectoiniformans]|uniref:acyl-homoserine-lactone synthase n=1 Tax=Aestuariispira ectoiniformans TaxID=2775080 RepID=UPI00223AB7C2|nr:acyl-homoserine-lactone synthase [Aestuariispira ectoiniformans]
MLSLLDNSSDSKRIQSVYRLRHRVFKERLDWEVNSTNNMEFDEFDHNNAYHLTKLSPQGEAIGCARIMPTNGPYMLKDVFGFLLPSKPPAENDLWEISRFAVDTKQILTNGYLSSLTTELLIGLVIIALNLDLSAYVAVVDLRMERIVNRTGWRTERLGKPMKVGSTTAVAIKLPTEESILRAMTKKNDNLSVKIASQPLLDMQHDTGIITCNRQV